MQAVGPASHSMTRSKANNAGHKQRVQPDLRLVFSCWLHAQAHASHTAAACRPCKPCRGTEVSFAAQTFWI